MERVWLHYDDPTFERFGGIYVPYNSQEEAERQAACDLLQTDNDPGAARILGCFQAEYGGHRDGSYNQPFGHLSADERKSLLTPDLIAKAAVGHQRALHEEQMRATEDHILAMRDAIESGRALKASVPGNAYSVVTGGTATGGAVALTAATAKTVVMLIASTANQPSWVEVAISFDGVTATAVPALVEWVSSTQGTAGTTTSFTAKQIRGWPAQSAQTTAAYNYTAEPTTLEAFKKRLVTPNGGLIVLQSPLGREPTGLVTAATQFKGMGVRITAPATVNCHVDAEFEE